MVVGVYVVGVLLSYSSYGSYGKSETGRKGRPRGVGYSSSNIAALCFVFLRRTALRGKLALVAFRVAEAVVCVAFDN